MRTRNEERAEQRRTEIIAAATRVFAAKGYQNAQIADIAGELGIGHGTVYRYFTDKRAVFSEVVDTIINRISASVLVEVPTANTLQEYTEQVMRIGERLFEVFTSEEEVAQRVFTEAPAADREIAAKVAAVFEGLAQLTAAYLTNGQDKGFLRADMDPLITAQAINAMILAGVRAVLASSDRVATKDAWLKQVSNIFLHGIEARS